MTSTCDEALLDLLEPTFGVSDEVDAKLHQILNIRRELLIDSLINLRFAEGRAIDDALLH